MREYLEAFRLPGESQKIDRILEAFSARFWSQTLDSTLFRSADAVHVLAFSAVLLNTDLHNHTVCASSSNRVVALLMCQHSNAALCIWYSCIISDLAYLHVRSRVSGR